MSEFLNWDWDETAQIPLDDQQSSPNQLPPEPETPKNRSFAREHAGMFAILAASLAINGGIVAAENLPRWTASDCGAPSADSIRTVTKMLNSETLPPGNATRLYDWHLRNSRRDMLTLQRINTSTPAGFDSLLAASNEMIRDYKVTIAIGSGETDVPDVEKNALKADDTRFYKSQSSKQSVKTIVRSLTAMPVSYVKYAGLKKIYLYRADEANENAYVAPDENGTMHYNLASPDILQTTIAHEMYHLVDRAECGKWSVGKDSSFTALNKSESKSQATTNTPDVGMSVKQSSVWYEKYLYLSHQIYDARAAGDKKQYDQLLAEAHAILNNIAYTSEYGMENGVVEDKAEVGSSLGNAYDFAAEALDPSTPIIRKKFIFELARLYEHAPQVVRSLIKQNARPPKKGVADPVFDWARLTGQLQQNYSSTQVSSGGSG
jgi:hypothetical protein